tara:strand:- start:6 stop:617 length:612 start_codon:yes stop_codon:yes gene_type:complete
MAYIGKAPANSALTADDITDGIIGADKLATNSVTTVKVSDANITSGKLASGLIPTNTPAFEAYLGSDQTVSSGTATKLAANTEVFDSDGKYDNSAYRFTPTVAGKYYIYGSIILNQDQNYLGYGDIRIYKNGSVYKFESFENVLGNANSYMHFLSLSICAVIDLDGDDYVELFGLAANFGGGSTQRFTDGTKSSYFGGYKLNI